jgi:Trk K+ transport system NAD-binding subunit
VLVTIGLTAMFTAGIVEHLLSGRYVGLVGRRVLPQRGHVVVVGMGQVGVRLAAELKALGLGVVGIERDISAPNLVTARALGIPVHVGDAARRRVLRRVHADRAVALCAAGSDELDNVAVAVTARAVSPTLRVVLRAGNHDVIAETQSLFRIGTVCDVTGLTACYVVHSLLDQAPAAVFSQESGVVVVDEAGVRRREPQVVRDCGHPLEGR